ANFILSQYESSESRSIKRWAKDFMDEKTCPECHGSRLRKESLYFKICNKNMGDIVDMDLESLQDWFINIPKKLNKKQKEKAWEILKDITPQSSFLLGDGLNYLSQNRSSRSLSSGDVQRIRLETQIGTQLVGVLYIMDETSIGIHQ